MILNRLKHISWSRSWSRYVASWLSFSSSFVASAGRGTSTLRGGAWKNIGVHGRCPSNSQYHLYVLYTGETWILYGSIIACHSQTLDVFQPTKSWCDPHPHVLLNIIIVLMGIIIYYTFTYIHYISAIFMNFAQLSFFPRICVKKSLSQKKTCASSSSSPPQKKYDIFVV